MCVGRPTHPCCRLWENTVEFVHYELCPLQQVPCTPVVAQTSPHLIHLTAAAAAAGVFAFTTPTERRVNARDCLWMHLHALRSVARPQAMCQRGRRKSGPCQPGPPALVLPGPGPALWARLRSSCRTGQSAHNSISARRRLQKHPEV